MLLSLLSKKAFVLKHQTPARWWSLQKRVPFCTAREQANFCLGGRPTKKRGKFGVNIAWGHDKRVVEQKVSRGFVKLVCFVFRLALLMDACKNTFELVIFVSIKIAAINRHITISCRYFFKKIKWTGVFY